MKMRKLMAAVMAATLVAASGVTAFAGNGDVAFVDPGSTLTSKDVVLEEDTYEGDGAIYIPLLVPVSGVQEGVDAGGVAILNHLTDAYLPVRDSITGVYGNYNYTGTSASGDPGSITGTSANGVKSSKISDFDDIKLTVSITDGKSYYKSCDIDVVDDDNASNSIQGVYAVVINLKDYYDAGSLTIKGKVTLKTKNGSKIDDYTFTHKIKNTSADNVIVVTKNEAYRNTNPIKYLYNATTTGLGVTVKKDECSIDFVKLPTLVPEINVFDFKSDIEYIELEADNFYFYVKASNQGKLALKFDNNINKTVARNAPANADLSFYNFKGSPTFDFTGTVTLTVPDEDETWYVYEINSDNTLTKVRTTSNDDDALEWKTRTLGNYVLSDYELDTSKDDDDDNTTTTTTTEVPSETPTQTDTDKVNPGTGSSDFVGVAVALAVVSVAAAGAVTLKKRED